jgi:hypothetical protein
MPLEGNPKLEGIPNGEDKRNGMPLKGSRKPKGIPNGEKEWNGMPLTKFTVYK